MTVLRDTPTQTLDGLAEAWATDRPKSWGGPFSAISFNFAGEGGVSLANEVTLPANDASLDAIGRLMDVPVKFLERITPAERQSILQARKALTPDFNVSIRYRDKETTATWGISEAWAAGKDRIEPWDILEQVQDVLPGESVVRDAWVLPGNLRIDVHAPIDYDRYWGGDKKVGDLTQGGLRVGQNRKANLAPWVQPFLYRLICTNGMEVEDKLLKVDARGQDIHDVLMDFKTNAMQAMSRVEADIQRFYHLRSQAVEKDYTGVMRRMGQDAGLPERVLGNLEDLLHAELEEGQDPTMFDLVNVMTNAANVLAPRSSGFRRLQQAGGGIIGDHSARCRTCHHKVA